MSFDVEPLALIRVDPGRHHRSSSAIKRRVDSGQLLRLKPGVFVETAAWIPAAPWTRHAAFIAATALSNPSAIFCDRTALALYGIPLLGTVSTIHLRARSTSRVGTTGTKSLTVPRAAPHVENLLRDAGVRWGRQRLTSLPENRTLPASGTSQVGGGQIDVVRQLAHHSVEVPVPGIVLEDGRTISARAEPLPEVLVSTVPTLSRQSGVVALDAAVSGRYGFGVQVGDAALDRAERLLPNTSSTAGWSWVREFADARSESPGESRARVLFEELGFEPPTLQHRLYLPGVGKVRLDFYWEGAGVVGEFDGRMKYSRNAAGIPTDDALQAEKIREDGLRMLDLQVVRFMWKDLDDPPELARSLLRKGVPHRVITSHLAQIRKPVL